MIELYSEIKPWEGSLLTVKVPWFVDNYRQYDPEYQVLVKQVIDGAMAEGPLDEKTRFLIALALDVYKGSADGVKLLAKQARDAGATGSEIAQVIRIAYYVMGMDVVKVALNAFDD